MATAERLSPGKYKVNGKVITASSSAEALKKAGVKSTTTKSNSKSTSTTTSEGAPAKEEEPKLVEPTEEEIAEIARKQNESAIAAGKKLAAELDDPSIYGKVSEERTQEEINALNMLKDEYASSKNRSGDATLALEKLRAGMEGLNSQEGMALREQARRELDSQFRNQMAQSKANAARSMTRGAAANAQSMILQRERAKAQGNLEQDLAVQNYGLKQQGVQNFAGFVNTLEQNEAARRQAASLNVANQTNSQVNRDLDRQTFNIDQNTMRGIQNQQNILGGAAIQSGAAQNAYAQKLGQQNQAFQRYLAKKELELEQKGLNIYEKSSNQVYGK